MTHVQYETVGSSASQPWLTLVHGFSQDRRYFVSALPVLRRRYRLLLVDLRGHGASVDIDGPFGVEEYADDLEAVFARESVEQTHYWGTHTGAAVGLVLALRSPRRLETLVLEGPVVPGKAMPRTFELQARASTIARLQGVAAAVDDWFEHADWFAYMREHPDEANAAGQRELVAEFSGHPWLTDLAPRPARDVRSQLARITQPTLIYNGVRDLEEFKDAAHILKLALPEVERLEIPRAGGFPLWENSEEVLTAVLRFLDKPRSGSRP